MKILKYKYALVMYVVVCLFFGSCRTIKQETTDIMLNVIPRPLFMKALLPNQNVSVKNINVVFYNDESIKWIAEYTAEVLSLSFEKKLKVTHISLMTSDQTNAIILSSNLKDSTSEMYTLKTSAGSVLIEAESEKGIFYGVQTLRQIVNNRSNVIPAVSITDEPRFRYRGVHLDVSRHFFPVEFIKKYIDILALHKFNYFHWHLTDDQGWRIEIKKYPLLTSIGGTRKETLVGHGLESMRNGKPFEYDGKPVSGFYTQEEIKDIVRYAKNRFIVIIPEIEMPGHSSAAIAAYPALSCRPNESKHVSTRWGVFNDILCPTDYTFKFLENVLSEVISLFPGRYIHIGGDESPKDFWKTSEFCQSFMKKQLLKNEEELQSYFIKRMEKFLNSKGKTIIGWDEILEGGIAPNTVVMSWRGDGKDGAIEAAKMSHEVIMTPNLHLYFDHYQDTTKNAEHEPLSIGGFTNIKEVYEYEPFPDSLTDTEKEKLVLGAQANVWTEYMKTSDHVEYMLLPRVAALSEVLWTSKQGRDWNNFKQRLPNLLDLYDKLSFNYAKHILKEFSDPF